jgi:hypothetical protein
VAVSRRLARFYGINPFQLAEQEELVLLAHLEPLWAEETLRDRQAELTAKGVYQLALLTTGDEVIAGDALADRVMDDLRNNRKVEI